MADVQERLKKLGASARIGKAESAHTYGPTRERDEGSGKRKITKKDM
jgi:hypothetical protein